VITKKRSSVFEKEKRVTPSVAALGVTNPSDTTESVNKYDMIEREFITNYLPSVSTERKV